LFGWCKNRPIVSIAKDLIEPFDPMKNKKKAPTMSGLSMHYLKASYP
jgi:hypothetical protein